MLNLMTILLFNEQTQPVVKITGKIINLLFSVLYREAQQAIHLTAVVSNLFRSLLI